MSAKENYNTVYEIRKLNAIDLCKKTGGMKSFSKKIDANYLYITRTIGSKSTQNIGDETARKIEKSFELPHGWLDNEHSDDKTDSINIYNIEDIPSMDIPLTKIIISSYGALNPYGIVINNSSYEPTIKNGTIIIFSSDVENLKPGDLVLVSYKILAHTHSTPILRYYYNYNNLTTFQPLNLNDEMDSPKNYVIHGNSKLILQEP